MAHSARKAALIDELARCRTAASVQRAGLSKDMEVGKKLKSSVSAHRGLWLGGATLLGLVLAKLPARVKKVPVANIRTKKSGVEKTGQAGILVLIAKMIFDLVKPALIRWGTQRVTQLINDGSFRPQPQQRYGA